MMGREVDVCSHSYDEKKGNGVELLFIALAVVMAGYQGKWVDIDSLSFDSNCSLSNSGTL